MLAGELYDASDPVLVEERMRARRLVRLFNQTHQTDSELRRQLLGELLGVAGKGTYIEPTFRCDYGYNIEVGDGFFANFDCIIQDVCKVKIGKNCQVAPGVHIYTATPRLLPSNVLKGR